MLEFSQIDANLSVYKKYKVFLWGAGVRGGQAMQILNSFKINIEAYIDSNPEKCGKRYFGIPIISFDDFYQRARTCDSCLVQICCENEHEIINKLIESSIRFISFEEFFCRTEQLGKYILMHKGGFYNLLCENANNRHQNNIERGIIQYYSWNIHSESKSCNLIVTIPKSGHTSLHYSYSGNVMVAGHTFEFIDKDVMEHIKKSQVNIICGVRDIISQRLSLCYQNVPLYWDMEEFWHGGGDVEAIFNKYYTGNIDNDCEYTRLLKKSGYDFGGPQFFDMQLKKHWDIDVYDYDFDKEKGYTIISKDNVNVLIYQLEKLNGLGKIISDFLGCGDEYTLQKENEASHKWYKDSYKRAQKEIKFTREYFHECYEGKYMKHFYNDEDIVKFKQKWIGNIKN